MAEGSNRRRFMEPPMPCNNASVPIAAESTSSIVHEPCIVQLQVHPLHVVIPTNASHDFHAAPPARHRRQHHGSYPRPFSPSSSLSSSSSSSSSCVSLTAPTKAMLLVLLHVVIVGIVLPGVFLLALQYQRAYLLLYPGHLVAAFGAWELTWFSHRLRQRLLSSLCVSTPPSSSMSAGKQQPHKYIISTSANRFCGGHCIVLALTIAATLATAMFGGTQLYKHYGGIAHLSPPERSAGWPVVVKSCVNATFLSVFASAFAPSRADAFVILVFEAAFVVSSLNTYLGQHVYWIQDTDMLDLLYLMLVTLLLCVTCRIVSSKSIWHSLFQIVFDMVGIAALLGPMMAIADIVDNRKASDCRNEISVFTIVLLSADIGNVVVAAILRRRHRWIAKWWKDAVPSSCQHHASSVPIDWSNKHHAIRVVLTSLVFAILGFVVAKYVFYEFRWSYGQVLVMVGAALVAQLCRSIFQSMKLTALGSMYARLQQTPPVTTTTPAARSGASTSRSSSSTSSRSSSSSSSSCSSSTTASHAFFGSIFVSITTFLIASIVFYPYIKTQYDKEGCKRYANE